MAVSSGKHPIPRGQAKTGKYAGMHTNHSVDPLPIATKQPESQNLEEALRESEPPPLEDINIFSPLEEPPVLITERIS